MPTKKQLSIMRESEYEYRTRRGESNVRKKNIAQKDGDAIGYIVYDPATKGLKVVNKNNT